MPNCLPGLVALATAALPLTDARADLTYDDFTNAAGTIALNGSATLDGPDLLLAPDLGGQAGSAWHTTLQPLAQGFETTFFFDIDGGETDGLAFVIQYGDLRALGSSGAGIGYDGIPNSVAVEFDKWYNGADGNGDPSNNHISVHTRGTDPNSSHHDYTLGSWTNFDFPWNRPAPVEVTIRYLPGTLAVWIDGRPDPDLTVQLDLAQTLQLGPQGSAFAGFTGSTGFGHARTAIESWRLTVIPAPAALPLVLLGLAALGRRR